MNVPKLVAGAAALTGTTMVGIGTVNADGGVFNVRQDVSTKASLDEYHRFEAEQGLDVPTELTRATDDAMQDHLDAARLHRNTGFTALGAGAVAAMAGVGSLLTHGSASSFLRMAAVGTAGGAAITGLAGWKTYAGLDGKDAKIVEAIAREDDAMLAARDQQGPDGALGGTPVGDASSAPLERTNTPERFERNWIDNDQAIGEQLGAEVQDWTREAVSQLSMVAREDDGSLDWAAVARSLDEQGNADGVVSASEDGAVLDIYGQVMPSDPVVTPAE